MARMQLLKFVRKRSFISELIYTVLNVALAVGIFLIVRYTEAVWFAIVLVILSKWRVFAVRPRYWWANLQSNMVDFILSISTVIHMYTINTQAAIPDNSKVLLLLGLMVLYIGWLLFIKPRSKRFFVALQAGIAVFYGTAALFTVSFNWPASIVVLFAWLIGYASARHALNSFDDETHPLFLSLVWGFVIAEISWIAYHWAIAYPLPIFPSLQLPQAAIMITLLSFLGYKVYDSFYHHSRVRMSDVLMPLLFTVSIFVVLLLIFNRVGTAI